jgi:hypothetical protein
MKIRIVKFIQCEPCSINGLKFLEISFFETLYIVIFGFNFQVVQISKVVGVKIMVSKIS